MLNVLRQWIAAPATRASWLALTLFLSLEKLIIYILDSNPQVFLGDSMSYLATALDGYVPLERSFVYGYVVYGLTQRARSLNSLVAAQTVAGILTALLVAVILVRFLRSPFVLAFVVAALLAIEPQLLLFERFALTESFTTLLFTVFMLLSLEYLRGRKLWLLILLPIAGALIVSLHASFVPLVITASVLAPIFGSFGPGGQGPVWFGLSRPERSRAVARLGVRLAISLSLMYGLHTAYQNWNGYMANLPPAYTYADGTFLLANVSPLVKVEDTDNPALAPVLARPLAYVNSSDRIYARNAEMFSEEGLAIRLRAKIGDVYWANREAKRIALHTIQRDPLGFLHLAWETYLIHFSKEQMKGILFTDSGVREIGEAEAKMLKFYHLYSQDLPFMKTLTRQYYIGSWRYLVLLSHTPLAVLACVFLARREWRRYFWFLFLTSAVHTGIVQAMGVLPAPRHMHAMAVILAIAVGALLARPLAAWAGQGSVPEKADAVRTQ